MDAEASSLFSIPPALLAQQCTQFEPKSQATSMCVRSCKRILKLVPLEVVFKVQSPASRCCLKTMRESYFEL
jgi:hypothetical protein